MDELLGTKELIFDSFVEMTSELGYENVSIRNIAKKVGIQPASLYNHFESKVQMLESAYSYYLKHYFDNRKPVAEMKKLIETANAQEILAALKRTFESEDQKKYIRMILITKIIYMRLYQDQLANEIFGNNFQNENDYVVEILRHGIDVGRIDPSFDIETFAYILIGSLVFMGVRAFSSPSYVVGQLEQEKRIFAQLTQLFDTALM